MLLRRVTLGCDIPGGHWAGSVSGEYFCSSIYTVTSPQWLIL